jgi:transcriptional regulator with XRE-family HTH domain
VNQFGEQIRRLREQLGLLQRQVANQLEMDTPMLSKIERGERNAKREQVTILSKIFNVSEEDLLSLWLADKVYDMVKDENVALKALSVTEEELKINPKRKKARK